jgi:uncharacterized protein DUF5338
MIAMTRRTTRHIIHALSCEKPITRSGLVRSLLPEIDAALHAGHTIKTIWERIHQQETTLSYRVFWLALKRLRAKESKSTAPANGEKGPTHGALPQDIRTSEFDPLANVKEAEATRSGFHYRGTEDLEELVHGRKNNHGKQKRRTN